MKKFFLLRSDFKFYNNELNIKNMNLLLFLSKRLNYAITFLTLFKATIFGLNLKYYIKNFCIRFGFSMFSIIQFIKYDLLQLFQKFFRRAFVNYELINYINSRIALKNSLKIYSGKKYSLNLPVRGQRTKTNAQTAKKRIKNYFDL